MNQKKSIMIVAGEASGDQYGARLVRCLKQRLPDYPCFGIGGDLMEKEGFQALYHIRQTSIMGFTEVVRNYGFLREMFSCCEKELKLRQPAVVVLIDYPGFNLRFAERIKRIGIDVVYYISPQVWAWGKRRTGKMRHLVDHLAVVFPFEEQLFSKEGIRATFVGHPLLEILGYSERSAFLEEHTLPDKRILALFPGSRIQEIERLLPPMLQAVDLIRSRIDCSIAIGATSNTENLCRRYISKHPGIHLLVNTTHQLMEHSYAAVVTSGTATVETAFYETPMVIVYKTSSLTYQLAKRLVTVDQIGMVNILANEQIVPELIQNQVTPQNIASQILPFFLDQELYKRTRNNLKRIRSAMGTPGASERVAEIVREIIQRNPNH